jgi:hypothetical protein
MDKSKSNAYTNNANESNSIKSSTIPTLCEPKPNQLSNLNVFAANFRSLNNKIQDFKCKLSELNVDLFMGCETWLTEETPNNFINSEFTIYRKDRIFKKGGGVIVGVKKHKSVLKTNFQTSEIELIWVEIKFKNVKFLCGAAYRPPNESMLNFTKNMKKSIKSIDNPYLIYL